MSDSVLGGTVFAVMVVARCLGVGLSNASAAGNQLSIANTRRHISTWLRSIPRGNQKTNPTGGYDECSDDEEDAPRCKFDNEEGRNHFRRDES